MQSFFIKLLFKKYRPIFNLYIFSSFSEVRKINKDKLWSNKNWKLFETIQTDKRSKTNTSISNFLSKQEKKYVSYKRCFKWSHVWLSEQTYKFALDILFLMQHFNLKFKIILYTFKELKNKEFKLKKSFLKNEWKI